MFVVDDLDGIHLRSFLGPPARSGSHVGKLRARRFPRGKAAPADGYRSGFLDPGATPPFRVDELATEKAAGTFSLARFSGIQITVAAHCDAVLAIARLVRVHLVTERDRGGIGFADLVDCLSGPTHQCGGEWGRSQSGNADLDEMSPADLENMSVHLGSSEVGLECVAVRINDRRGRKQLIDLHQT